MVQASPAPERWDENDEQPVRFPGNDGGQSLAETAQRDLNAALQLLAERARYITGAMAATIALREGEQLLCRACIGSGAQKIGVVMQVGSGLAAESMRTRRILRCHDAATDARVNLEKCRKFGIGSAMVMPLVNGQEIVGVFELLSGNANAFEERDLNAMERLGEMIETAVEQAAAVRQVPTDSHPDDPLAEPQVIPLATIEPPAVVEATAPEVEEAVAPVALAAQSEEAPLLERGTIGSCQNCSFPVSGRRRLCVYCETNGAKSEESAEAVAAPAFLSETARPARKSSWFRYVIGVVLVGAILVEVAILWLRFH